ncbi:hypothetical protein O7622_26295 [Micromonospora sp. WMMD1076]|uniref:hypothetical protein n=1 Tax=Micromonospora sp. WMMD1076 TaxID=3016103 RepID=UPI00249C8A5F|nr:hypothetical protein [Micromonospora sp. WMMD1076]WFF06519.1 hypothetical protein O7622_26295 [Micromonospora sp. WMMD1076]
MSMRRSGVGRPRAAPEAAYARAAAENVGCSVTDDDVERARRRLAQQPPITDEQHDRNMEWLRQFGGDGAAGA